MLGTQKDSITEVKIKNHEAHASCQTLKNKETDVKVMRIYRVRGHKIQK